MKKNKSARLLGLLLGFISIIPIAQNLGDLFEEYAFWDNFLGLAKLLFLITSQWVMIFPPVTLLIPLTFYFSYFYILGYLSGYIYKNTTGSLRLMYAFIPFFIHLILGFIIFSRFDVYSMESVIYLVGYR